MIQHNERQGDKVISHTVTWIGRVNNDGTITHQNPPADSTKKISTTRNFDTTPEGAVLEVIRKVTRTILPSESPGEGFARARCSFCKGLGQIRNPESSRVTFRECYRCFGDGFKDRFAPAFKLPVFTTGNSYQCIKCNGKGFRDGKTCACCKGRRRILETVDPLYDTKTKVTQIIEPTQRTAQNKEFIGRALKNVDPSIEYTPNLNVTQTEPLNDTKVTHINKPTQLTSQQKEYSSSQTLKNNEPTLDYNLDTTPKENPQTNPSHYRAQTESQPTPPVKQEAPKSKPITYEKLRSLIHPKTKFNHQHVDENRLNHESQKRCKILINKGSKPIGSVKQKHGTKISINQRGKNLIVTAPFKLKPKKRRRALAKAQAYIITQSLKKSHPKAFKRLALHANNSYIISLIAYSEVIKTGSDFMKHWKAIGIKKFGNFDNLRRNFKNPKAWGFSDDYDRRKNWIDELVDIYSLSEEAGGIKPYARELKIELAKARNVERLIQRKHNDASWIKKQDFKRQIDRAQLRIAILHEIHDRKLPLICSLFYTSNNPFSPETFEP